MPQMIATRVPTFALYGDGRVIVQGLQTLEFPGPRCRRSSSAR